MVTVDVVAGAEQLGYIQREAVKVVNLTGAIQIPIPEANKCIDKGRKGGDIGFNGIQPVW